MKVKMSLEFKFQILIIRVKMPIGNLFRAGIRMPKRVQLLIGEANVQGRLAYQEEPSRNQIKHQLVKLKKEIYGSGEISLGELQQYLIENSAVSDDPDQPFVIGFDVRIPPTQTLSDSDESDKDSSLVDKTGFWFLISTKRLLGNGKFAKTLAADSTFKLLWQGFSGILMGTVDPKKQYHKLAFGFTTSEMANDYKSMFKVREFLSPVINT